MGFLDILRKKGNGKPKTLDEQRGDCAAALAAIAEERAAAQAVIDGLDQRREKLLRDDAPEAEIVALDHEGEVARIKLEKLELFEVEVHAKLSEIEGVEAEAEWRVLFDARHQAACEYAEAYHKAAVSLSGLQHATAAATHPIGGRWFQPDVPPWTLQGTSGEFLQNFLREIERLSDYEHRRREAIDRLH
jgi:hypothetical protein